jgi:hypothetical protein
MAASAVIAASGVLAFAAAPASAKHAEQTVVCGQNTYVVRTVQSNSSQNGGWGSAVILEGGSGVGTPTSFSLSLVDNSLEGTPTLFTFSSTKGGGNANHNQVMTSCTVTTTGTVADFVPPGTQLPDGASLSDSATETIDVTVVIKP